MRTLKDLKEVKGKRVVLRLDLNVPIENGEVVDAYRIESSLPTIDHLLQQGAKIIVIAHLGKGKPEDTLRPVAQYLRDRYDIRFLSSLMIPDNKLVIEQMNDGEVVMLENLRYAKGEEDNDDDFAKYLASLGEIYVNDAFAVSHRAHASVVGITKYLPSYAGLLFEKEVENLSVAFNPEHPFLFILGGSKISTKIPLMKKFLPIADHLLIGGANANNLLKAKGYEIGTSVVDESALSGLEEYVTNEKILIPKEVVVRETRSLKASDQVLSAEMIVDIGEGFVRSLQPLISAAKLIVWNGPLGFYEEGFTGGSKALLELIVASNARTIVGGGDTVALVDSLGMHDQLSFVSTGGGAMLDYLANGTLPGIEVLIGQN